MEACSRNEAEGPGSGTMGIRGGGILADYQRGLEALADRNKQKLRSLVGHQG